jgi:uncharacterized DUF497 family protein
MTSVFDARKNAANKAKHGVGFEAAAALDWDSAITAIDRRQNYGEVRYLTYALLHNRLHCFVWTWRDGAQRPISLRKANARERKDYENEKKH